MRTRAFRRVAARYTWDRLKVSFWFAPAVMSLAAILLAWVMYWVDSLIPICLLFGGCPFHPSGLGIRARPPRTLNIRSTSLSKWR